MSNQEWPAEEYAIGSYIQSTVADKYLHLLKIKADDAVLDIGCGNGTYTKKILAKVPRGSVLGIDASAKMLQLAEEVRLDYPNFTVQQADVLNMDFIKQFDYVVSYWCLQWAQDLHKAFSNIFNALKPGGKICTIFPYGNDPYIMSYYALRDSGQFKSLKHFKAPVDYTKIHHSAEQLNTLAYTELKVEVCQQHILLPSLDIFRKFVNGIAFYQGQIPDAEIKEINEAMVNHFAEECQTKYQGQYQFHFTIYCITGMK